MGLRRWSDEGSFALWAFLRNQVGLIDNVRLSYSQNVQSLIYLAVAVLLEIPALVRGLPSSSEEATLTVTR